MTSAVHPRHLGRILEMNRLKVVFFVTSDANQNCIASYLDGANKMLDPYGMGIDVQPGPGGKPWVLPYQGAVFDQSGDPATIRAQCHNALPVGFGIPVIFCKRNTDDVTTNLIEFGSTIQTSNPTNGGIPWPPYILINTQAQSTAGETLLHEMIHASYGENQPNKPRDPHDPDLSSTFYHDGTLKGLGGSPIRKLPAKHADALRKAYFSVYCP